MANTFRGSLVVDGVVVGDDVEFEFWTVRPPGGQLQSWGGRFTLQAERLARARRAGRCEIRLADGRTIPIAVTGGGASRADFTGLGEAPMGDADAGANS
jgi:hypothetical protein